MTVAWQIFCLEIDIDISIIVFSNFVWGFEVLMQIGIYLLVSNKSEKEDIFFDK